MYTYTVIVPIYQEINIFRLFYESLCASIRYRTQLIFINDNSGESVSAFLNEIEKNPPVQCKIDIITHETNLGCAKCINEAFHMMQGSYSVLMDSDIILPNNWQDSVLDTMHSHCNTCVGAVLLYPQTGGIQNCGITFARSLGRHLFLNSKPERLKKYNIYEVQSTVFAFFAAPTDIIRKTGMMDENFFNGYEDLDYQLRLRKLGGHIVINPEIKIYHWEQSNGIHRYLNRKSNLGLFWKKHADELTVDLWDFLFYEFENYEFLQTQYTCIDLAGARMDAEDFLSELKKRFPTILTNYIDCSHWIQDFQSVLLPKVVHIDLFREQHPILFLCDNFVQLSNNYYWYTLRANYNEHDLIVDLYGNVVELKTLILQSWPGNKIR